jgi:ribosomal-protein-serine acetyltransferase
MFAYKIDEELSLKLIESKDAQEIFELTDQNREYLREWLPWVDITNKVEDTQNFIKMSLNGFANRKSLDVVILYKGKAVGIVGYNEINHVNNIAYIGYWIAGDYQGKGIMTRATKSIVDYAFNNLGLNRVEIRAAVENVKSRAVPERLGFTNEGVIRSASFVNDKYYDMVVYGMLADEWIKR